MATCRKFDDRPVEVGRRTFFVMMILSIWKIVEISWEFFKHFTIGWK